MIGQMCWLSQLGTGGEKILHIRTHPNQPWQPYTTRRELAVPDYDIPNGSRGWATYQKLLRMGWTLIPSAEAQVFSLSNSALAERAAS